MTRARILTGILAASLAASMVLVAQSEYRLALAVGWPPAVAWAAPAALDLYVAATMLARRGVAAAIAVSAVSVLVSHAVHAAPGAWASGRLPDAGAGEGLVWPLAAACSVVPLLVTWQVHRLLHDQDQPAPAPDGVDAPSAAAPDTDHEDAWGVTAPSTPTTPPAAAPTVPPAPTVRASAATDEQLLTVIRGVLAHRPDAGRDALKTAIRAAGYTVGTTRLERLAEQARQPRLVTGSRP